MKLYYKKLLLVYLFGFCILIDSVVGVDAEQVFTAMVKAYPDKVSDVIFQKGDWTVKINGKTVYWAGGRVLPDNERESEMKYTPYRFYTYPRVIPPLRKLDSETQVRINEAVKKQEAKKDFRHPALFNALWGVDNYQSTNTIIKPIIFLKKEIRVHRDIVGQLKLIEKEIYSIAQRNKVVRDWINSLSRADGFVWRSISGSANRSLHSYGIAIDLTLKEYNSKHVYWRWSKQYIHQWWAIPYRERYFPPTPVIQVFEKYGFIWGGKWLFFDQVHFEYRPELMILNGFKNVSALKIMDEHP